MTTSVICSKTVLRKIRVTGEAIEVIEHKSVCCYRPGFFVEMLPMSYYLRLILPLDFDEVDIPEELHVYDTTTWKFVPNRVHTECGLLVDVYVEEDVTEAMPMIWKAFDMAEE